MKYLHSHKDAITKEENNIRNFCQRVIIIIIILNEELLDMQPRDPCEREDSLGDKSEYEDLSPVKQKCFFHEYIYPYNY